MATPLADVPALEARLGRTLTGSDITMAEAALKSASAMVRAYGLPWPDPLTAPEMAVEVTLNAAERKMRNPEGLRQEMEGGYQYTRNAGEGRGTTLEQNEIRALRAAIGFSGVISVPISSLGGAI